MWTRWWLWPLVAVCTADFFRDEAERIMRDSPVIDGHNDLPWQLLDMFNNQLQDARANLTTLADTHTNIPKLRAGFVGGQATMKATLQLSRAPVIFSHSSAYSVCASRRNVPDDVLRLVKQTDSLVMVNFYNNYISCTNKANLSQVADHLDHIKEVAGARAVGFGGDFDGVSRVPEGLEDVSKYPDLIAELLRRNWTEAEVKGALANNLLRVFEAVEQASNPTQAPEEEPIPRDELGGSCRTYYGYPSGASNLHRQWGFLLASLAPLVLCLCLL
ncbi:hypothetical protein H8959_001184 [Pygathrix nigripes]